MGERLMKLIPQWKKWWKRHSSQILLMIPLIEALRQWLPTVRDMITPEAYGWIAGGLSLTAIIVMQIKQNSVSGDKQNGDS